MSVETNKIIRAGILLCFFFLIFLIIHFYYTLPNCWSVDRLELVRNQSFTIQFTTGVNNMDFDKHRTSHNKNKFEKSSPIFNLPEFKQIQSSFLCPFQILLIQQSDITLTSLVWKLREIKSHSHHEIRTTSTLKRKTYLKQSKSQLLQYFVSFK